MPITQIQEISKIDDVAEIDYSLFEELEENEN